MKTFENLENQLANIQHEMNIANSLVGAGVPKKYATVFSDIYATADCDYTMGEIVIIKCNGVDMYRHDARSYYSGEWRGKEKHGKCVYNLTKKAIRELCEELSAAAYWYEKKEKWAKEITRGTYNAKEVYNNANNNYFGAMRLASELCAKYWDANESVTKGGKIADIDFRIK